MFSMWMPRPHCCQLYYSCWAVSFASASAEISKTGSAEPAEVHVCNKAVDATAKPVTHQGGTWLQVWMINHHTVNLRKAQGLLPNTGRWKAYNLK